MLFSEEVYYFVYKYGWYSFFCAAYELAVPYDITSINPDFLDLFFCGDAFPVDFAIGEKEKIIYMLEYSGTGAGNISGWYYKDKQVVSSISEEETANIMVLNPDGSIAQEPLNDLIGKADTELFYGTCYRMTGDIAADDDGTWKEIFVDGVQGNRLPAFIGQNAVLDVEIFGNGILKDFNNSEEHVSSFLMPMQIVFNNCNGNAGATYENSWYNYHDGYDSWRSPYTDYYQSEFCYELDWLSNRVRFFARNSFYNRQNNKTNQMHYDIRVRVRHDEKASNYNF